MSGIKALERQLHVSENKNIFDDTKILSKYLKDVSIFTGNTKEEDSDITLPVLLPGKEREVDINEEQNSGDLTSIQSSGGLICSTCKISFEDVEKQREHFKFDWHRFNLKAKLLGKPCLSETEFEEQISGELSSISGSDSDSDDLSDIEEINEPIIEEAEDDNNQSSVFMKHPFKFFFKTADNILFSIYKNVVVRKKHENLEEITNINIGETWVYIMLSGGHFAASVYKKNEILAHKTFHRYTIRAKRGTTQRVQDNKQGGHAPKSAGSSIRRHNEAALIQDIHNLLTSWSEYINKADRIFYRCSTYNNNILFCEKSNIIKDDKRLVKISMMTRRPTLKEVKRIHSLFSTIDIYGNLETMKDLLCNLYVSPALIHSNQSKNIKRLEETTQNNNDTLITNTEEVTLSGTHLKDKSKRKKKSKKCENAQEVNEVIEICRCPPVTEDFHLNLWNTLKDKACQLDNDTIKQIFTDKTIISNQTEVESEKFFFEKNLINFCCKHHPETLLHCAAKVDNKEMIEHLMQEGADPTIKNYDNKLPYHVSNKKETRNEFRKFMAKYPDKYDYKKADIPSPLTEAEELEQQRKAADKKKAQSKARKDRNKVKKAEERADKLIEKEKKSFEALSDREKRAVMAERRFATQLTNSSKCSQCRSPIDEKSAFKRYEYMYCTTDCAHKHKIIIGK